MNNKTKATAIIFMAALSVAGIPTAAAKKATGKAATQRASAAPDTVVVHKTDTVYLSEGELGEIAGIHNQYQLEAYKMKLEKEAEASDRAMDFERESMHAERKAREARMPFKNISQYCMLFCICILLPFVVLFVYLHHSKTQMRRYEMLVDLLREGVDIRPDILDALAVSRTKYSGSSVPGVVKGRMSAGSFDYCIRRVIYSVTAVGMGIVMSASMSQSAFFVISVIFAGVLMMQAAIQYFNSRYIERDARADNAAGTTVDNTHVTPASDADAQ